MKKSNSRLFQVQAHTRLQRFEAVNAARVALSAAGASVTDIRHYSNKSSVFQLLLPSEAWSEMFHLLRESTITIDSVVPGTTDELIKDKDGDINGTLQLLYVGDESETRDEIPAVPG
ncbi:MAG: hypothetical protein ACK5F2_06865 [Roseateles sp.]|jgi:hypothetical protein